MKFNLLKAGAIVFICLFFQLHANAQKKGVRYISTNGYDNCIELINGDIRVVLEPNCGGRVLYFERNGKNVLFINPEQDGIVYDGSWINGLCAGRFDIGPSDIIPGRPTLFFGKYEAEITGDYSAKLTSQVDEKLGVQLVREFTLDPESPKLSCTQIIKNVSKKEQRYNTWSRTFANPGGICLCPINPESRYPEGYLLYGPNNTLEYKPAAYEELRVRDGVLELLGPQTRPKSATDASEGWLAYLSTNDILFLKTFPIYPEEIYGEIAANPVAIFYNEDVCEIEPTSPWYTIQPGGSCSFTEDWWLFDFKFPEDKTADLDAVRAIVKQTEGL